MFSMFVIDVNLKKIVLCRSRYLPHSETPVATTYTINVGRISMVIYLTDIHT